MLSHLEISIHHRSAASGKRSEWEIMGKGERASKLQAHAWSSECFLVVVVVLCFSLSLVLYNVS